jgi:DNA-directed RNA polymerase I and III subunit RPAC1
LLITSGIIDSNQSTDRNTIVFTVKLQCERNKEAPKGSTDPKELYINHELLSSHLKWKPAGEQKDVFASNIPAPTNPNIVLAKLRPGQAIDIELHAVKGVGKDHGKFSPVGMYKSIWLALISPMIEFHTSNCHIPHSPAHHHQAANSSPPRR